MLNLITLGNNNDLKGIYHIFYCNKTRIVEYGEDKFYNEFPIIKFSHLFLGYINLMQMIFFMKKMEIFMF